MNPLDRLEAALERAVEGGAGRVFRTRLQPAEIGRRLERSMADSVVVGLDRPIAANRFRVSLHPADLTPLAGAAATLGAQFAGWLEGVASERDWRVLGPVVVDFAADPTLARREVRVAAEMMGDPEAAGVAGRSEPPVSGPVRLLIASGAQRGQEVLARQPQAVVGRAAECDIVLLDASVSRRHARIEVHRAGARLVDLDSTNGTWRNGERISAAPLRSGDEVRFGGVAVRVLAGGGAG